MNRPKLSICMATRNRAAYIGATLESIVSQATDEVEVVVLDGASTDDTGKVIRLCQNRFLRLRYFRQETNMGIDRDFAKAVELAHGEYCWLFCDDDLLRPGAIRAELEAIKKDYAVIIANSEVLNADLSILLEPKRLPLDADKIYRSSENDLLLGDTGDYLSFIGSVIIKRKVWETRQKEKYFGSYFIHVGMIFQEPLPGDALVIAEPLVSIRYANASWLGKYFEIWMFKWPSIVWSFAQFPDSVKNRVCLREPWRSPGKLLHFRAKGVYSKQEYEQWLKPRSGSFWTRMLEQAIAYFPGQAANLLAYVYYSTFRRPSARLLLLLDLANSPFCFWKLRKRRHGFSTGSRDVGGNSPLLPNTVTKNTECAKP